MLWFMWWFIDNDLLQAEEKLEESKQLAEQAMFNVLDNDVWNIISIDLNNL